VGVFLPVAAYLPLLAAEKHRVARLAPHPGIATDAA
jgi:hypothetical protein